MKEQTFINFKEKPYTGSYRDFFFEEHHEKVSGVVLDIGAGGPNTFEDYPNVNEYHMLDIEREEHLDLLGDARDVPFKSSSIDTVVMSEVLEHIPIFDWEDVFDEVCRVLKEDGTFMASTPFFYPLHQTPGDHLRPTVFGFEEILDRKPFNAYEVYRGGSLAEVFLQTLYTPFRSMYLYVHYRPLYRLFYPLHILTELFSLIVTNILDVTYGENPWGTRLYLTNFVIAEGVEK